MQTRQERFRLKAVPVLFLLLSLLFLCSSCSSLVDELFGPAWTWPSLETEDQPVQNRSENPTAMASHDSAATKTTDPPATGSTATAVPTDSPDRHIDFTLPTPAFDEQVSALIQEGLEGRARSISLDPVFTYWHVRESQVQEAIDRIYGLFSDIYHRQPQFFYLNGSFQVYYSVLRSGNSEIAGLRLEPAYWSSTGQLSEEELADMIDAVETIVMNLAFQIRTQTNDPHNQLVLLQEWLIRHIRYDAAGDQGTNHAGSALLQQVTLCQGYAQSFQLVGQALGHDVRLITGSSEGIGHAWNQVILAGIAYHVDVTHDDPTPDENPERPVRHIHLFRSDDIFAETHQWDKALFLPSPDDGAFYYHMRDLAVASRSELKQRFRQFIADLDLSEVSLHQLELLYTGADLPEAAELEELFVTELQGQISGMTVYYRTDIMKHVVIVQVSHEN